MQRLKTPALLIAVYAVAVIVLGFLTMLSSYFAYGVLSLVAAIPLWIVAVFLRSSHLDQLRNHIRLIGFLIGALPALFIWLGVLARGGKMAEIFLLFPVIVLPPTLISCCAAILAGAIAFYRQAEFAP